MNTIRALRASARMTQSEFAQAAGTSQPTVAAYETGTKSPTLRTVDRLARRVGLESVVVFFPPMTREERRSLALHRAIAERLFQDPEAVLALAQQTLTKMRGVASPSSHVMREWAVLLDRPLDALAATLTDSSPWARELRHSTPFAGVLTAEQRRNVIAAFAASEGRLE